MNYTPRFPVISIQFTSIRISLIYPLCRQLLPMVSGQALLHVALLKLSWLMAVLIASSREFIYFVSSVIESFTRKNSNPFRYDVTFVGMVLPGDQLSVAIRHTGMRDGNIVVKVF